MTSRPSGGALRHNLRMALICYISFNGADSRCYRLNIAGQNFRQIALFLLVLITYGYYGAIYLLLD
jgi:hypothetical protein